MTTMISQKRRVVLSSGIDAESKRQSFIIDKQEDGSNGKQKQSNNKVEEHDGNKTSKASTFYGGTDGGGGNTGLNSPHQSFVYSLVFKSSSCASCAFYGISRFLLLIQFIRNYYRLRSILLLLVLTILVASGVVGWASLFFQWLESTWLNPVVRVKPAKKMLISRTDYFAFETTPFSSMNQHQLVFLRDGKSCDYHEKRWHCQECYRGECHPLKRRRRRRRHNSFRLRRRDGHCPPFPRQEWDSPFPRKRSFYSAHDPYVHDTDFIKSDQPSSHHSNIPIQILTRFGISKSWRIEYEQPVCTVSTCFNLTKCDIGSGGGSDSMSKDEDDQGGSFTIYSKYPVPDALQRLLLSIPDNDHNATITTNETRQRRPPYRLVNDPHDACLIVVFPHQYSSLQNLVSTPSWKDGRNHLIWNAACHFFSNNHYDDEDNEQKRKQESLDWFCDQPFSNLHYGLAALAHTQLTSAHVRLGYDIPLPLPRHWKRTMPLKDVPLASQRPVLLSFRGSVQDTMQPYYQHRWLAAEYWEQDDDDDDDGEDYEENEDKTETSNNVVVNVQCIHRRKFTWWGFASKNHVIRAYDNDNQHKSFEYLLLNSTFVFTPGGSGVNTYRFGEVLSAGGIPVVTPDFVPPLAPELDWSPCLVVVSESRIVDLPRILRQEYPFHRDVRRRHISPGNATNFTLQQQRINQRQQACMDLFKASMGDKYHEASGDKNSGGWLHNDQVIFEQAIEIMRLRIIHARQYKLQSAQKLFNRKNKKVKNE